MKAEEILARALEYEAAGHLELASQEYIRYADILWQNGEREEAVAYYETADALSPLPSNARHTLADMYFQLGETSKAAQEYASVASLYAEQGLIDSSIKICKFFQEKLPAETTLSYELADLYLKAERTQRAVNEYLRIIELGQDSALAYERLGAIYQRRNSMGEAVDAFIRSGEGYARKGEYERSANQYEYILRIHPDSISARKKRLEFLALAGKSQLFLEELFLLGEMLLQRGMREKATACFQKVVELDSSHDIAKARLAQMGTAAKKVTLTQPPQPPALDKKAKTRFNIEMNKEVVASLDSILEELGRGEIGNMEGLEDPATHYDLGLAYLEMDLFDEAIKELQIASRAPQLRVKSCNMLGLCFMERGEVELAIKEYERGLSVLSREEEQIGLRYNLARAYETLGNYQEAINQLREIYAVDVNYLDVKQRLREIVEKQKDGRKGF